MKKVEECMVESKETEKPKTVKLNSKLSLRIELHAAIDFMPLCEYTNSDAFFQLKGRFLFFSVLCQYIK